MPFDIRDAGVPASFKDEMNQSATAVRNVLLTIDRQPLFPRRARQKCRSCGHQSIEHIGFPDAAVAEQLSLIHGGCLDCESCADE
ncbi:MAG TPA: hypothetical protein VMI09_01870 [Candidatus Binataceae bacterium]|nr:hypothetical protein [Candidatus Binataceae bacterium]